MTKFDAARTFIVGEEGASLVEYSLLVALIAAACIAALYGLGQEVGYIFAASNNSVSSANEVITTAS
jgi:Flp pilus assembly pilin Flp